MYWQILFVVFIWMVDVISERHFINAFHNNDGASSCLMRRKRQQQQQLSLGRSVALEIFPAKRHSATPTKTRLFVLPLRREIFITDQWQRHHRKNIRLQAIHEPQSDRTSSKSLSHWSPSSLFQSLRIKDRNQLSSLISASVIIGLSSYYFYKGIYSISSSVSFWKAEGDLILKPLSVATWSAELIGYDLQIFLRSPSIFNRYKLTSNIFVMTLRLITLSKSMVYLLVGLTQLSPLQAAALSGIPCLLYLLRGIITQSLMRVGFNPYFAPLVISYATLVNILTFTKLVSPKTLKRYLYMPLMAAGIFAWSMPTTSATLFGIQLKTAMDKVLWIFVGRSLISTGTLIYSLALGGDAKRRFGGLSKAMRNMTASTAATTIIDVVFTRRNELLAAGFSLNKAYRFILVSLAASGVLFVLPGP